MKRVLPSYLLDQVVGEIHVAIGRVRFSRANRRYLSRMTSCRVNVGCGSRPTPKWVNIDLYNSADVRFWDCRKDLPFRDNSVLSFYSEHAFEHLDPNDAIRFLKEALRCLEPNGVIRLVVPDAGRYLQAYSRDWGALAVIRQLSRLDTDSWYDPWLGSVYATKLQLINAIFRQGYEHKYAYDEETLTAMLKEAGFSRVFRQEFNQSTDRFMAPDSPDRQAESLYVEASK